jgi:hypothetical protein
VNDGPFNPPLGPDEYGDAVMGLCNLQSLKGVDFDVVLNCIAVGTGNFARRKVGGTDASIHWKMYATKMNAVLTDWQKVIANTASMQTAAPKVQPLAALIASQVLTPMEQFNKNNPSTTAVNLEGLNQWLSQRTAFGWIPFKDLKDDAKPRFTLKPVLAKD